MERERHPFWPCKPEAPHGQYGTPKRDAFGEVRVLMAVDGGQQATSAQKRSAEPTLLGKGEPPEVGENPKGLPRTSTEIVELRAAFTLKI